MTIKNYVSPTGSPIVGTLENLVGRAEITGISPTGEPEHAGETTIFWDDQKTVTRGGKIVFLDEDGGEWTFDELVSADDAGGDAAS